MIHFLFNNLFMEDGNAKAVNNSYNVKNNKENIVFPITEDNENVLLYLLDLYEKSQQIFSVNKSSSTEYLDIVNYIELNFAKQDILCNLFFKII